MDKDALYAELQTRLIQTGERDRLQQRLYQALNEAGWIDDVKHECIENAQTLESPTLQTILDNLASSDQALIPPETQKEFQAVIKEWIQLQLSK